MVPVIHKGRVCIMPRLTQKGQVTIPLVVRRMLHLKGGDEIFFEIQDGKVSLRKRAGTESLDKYVGFLAHLQGRSSDEIVNELRGRANDCGD